ncbi:unnamed protein product [Rhodiola kirilowii]
MSKLGLRIYSSCLFLHLFRMFHVITAIRKDVGFVEVQFCRTSVQGRYLLADDHGHVCDALVVNPETRCCPSKGGQYSCQGCKTDSQCCNSYEFCVSCCLDPARTQKEEVLKVKIAKPVTAGTYTSVFDYCAGRCRHSSESVVHENAYLSDAHHCFSLPANSSGITGPHIEARLGGINVVIGRQAESCDSVCKSNGLSCVATKLLVLNECDIIQKHMSCKGGCLPSLGSDQPAEVVDDAPKDLNPGACLYSREQRVLSCDGSHRHTKRLCPCA